jgi:hypothetical protein
MPDHTDHPDHTDRSAAGEPRRDLLTFDRYDRWGLVFLLGAAALGAVVAGVVEPIADWVSDAPLTPEVTSAVTVPPLDATGVAHGPGTYALELADPGAGQRLLELLPGLLAALLVVLACWCVVLLLRTVAAGDPFHPLNVTRLRVVAASLALGWPVVLVLQFAVNAVLLGSADLGGLELDSTIALPWVPLVAGMVVAMLAEAFKAGSRLRDDVDGLV